MDFDAKNDDPYKIQEPAILQKELQQAEQDIIIIGNNNKKNFKSARKIPNGSTVYNSLSHKTQISDIKSQKIYCEEQSKKPKT